MPAELRVSNDAMEMLINCCTGESQLQLLATWPAVIVRACVDCCFTHFA